MKKLILFIACSFLAITALAQQPTFQWAGGFDSSLEAWATNIAVDPSGNVLTIGQFTGTIDCDPGPGVATLTSNVAHWGSRPMYISKLDPAGNFLWVKKIDRADANAIKTDAAGNIFITGKNPGASNLDPDLGTFPVTPVGNGDIYIVKLDPNGNFLWGAAMGSADIDAGIDVVIDQASDVYVVGTYNGTIDFDPGAGVNNLSSPTGTTSTFVLKLTNTGTFIWAKTFQAEVCAVALDAAGIYLTGSFKNTVDLDPGAGTFNATSNGGSDVFVSKLDLAGNFVWAKTIGDVALNDIGNDVAVDATGNIIVGGVYSGAVDFDPGAATYTIGAVGGQDVFILKLDNTGNFSWARTLGGLSTEHSKDLALDAAGNIYTIGYFIDVCDFDPGVGTYTITTTPINTSDGFISKLDPSGNFVWAHSYGAGFYDKVSDVAVNAAGDIYMTGDARGTVDLDPGAGVSNVGPSTGGYGFPFVTKLSGGAVTALSNNPGIYNQSINVYPNPAGNYVTLKSNTVEKTNYFVYDMVGKEIVKGSYNESTTIQLFSYAKGIYLIRCESSLGTSYTKLVIEN